jgi:hypothetical protein
MLSRFFTSDAMLTLDDDKLTMRSKAIENTLPSNHSQAFGKTSVGGIVATYGENDAYYKARCALYEYCVL